MHKHLRTTTIAFLVALSLGCQADVLESGEADGAALLPSGKLDAASTGPVRLVESWQYSGSKYGQHWTQSRFAILVRDLAYEKDVAIWYEGEDGQWDALSADYAGPAWDGWQLWKAETAIPLDRFVVRYRVRGETHWDNNGGRDYFIEDSGANLVGVNVRHEAAFGLLEANDYTGPSSHFTVVVNVRNLAYDKRVRVVYSTDGWETVREAPLHFTSDYYYGYGTIHSPNAHGVEHWLGDVEVGTDVDRVDYAISYEVDGRTHWDNNFGHNYRIERRAH